MDTGTAAPAHRAAGGSPPEGEAGVDIHKPKPVHSIREFLNEIMVIITGVLIALGLEQAVESWHHHEQVEQAKEALNESLIDNASRIEFVRRTAPCFIANLDVLQTFVEARDVGKVRGFYPVDADIRPDGKSVRMRVMSLNTDQWDIAKNSERITYFSNSDINAYGRAMGMMEMEKKSLQDIADYAISTYAHASVYDGSPQATATLHEEIGQIRWRLARRVQLYDQARERIRGLVHLDLPYRFDPRWEKTAGCRPYAEVHGPA
jgi:hypothetical protein